jgi:hypothetical protein
MLKGDPAQFFTLVANISILFFFILPFSFPIMKNSFRPYTSKQWSRYRIQNFALASYYIDVSDVLYHFQFTVHLFLFFNQKIDWVMTGRLFHTRACARGVWGACGNYINNIHIQIEKQNIQSKDVTIHFIYILQLRFKIKKKIVRTRVTESQIIWIFQK